MAKAKIVDNIAMAIDIPGSNKAQWTNVGVIVEMENGKRFGKINYLPVGGWNGKFCLFPVTHDKKAGEFSESLEEEPQDF